MKIAYISIYLPRLTETFVYREIYALQDRGFEVVPLSIKTPDPAQLSAESLELFEKTSYFVPLKVGKTLRAHLSFLLRRPARYLRTLWNVMAVRGESWSNRRRTFGHFAGGVFQADYLRGQGVSHIHAHFSANAATTAYVAARMLDISFSFTAHNALFTDQLILRQKIEAARFIVAISDYTLNYLKMYTADAPALHQKFARVYCGIDPAAFPMRHNPPVAGPPLIFSVSRMEPRKGYPYLIEALHLLRERGVRFRAVIGGDGEEMGLVRSQIEAYGLADLIDLPGFILQEEIRDYFNEAALFVLPCVVAPDGDVDGIPVTLMEVMAIGVPVISTAVSGIPELIEDGCEGLIVLQKSADQLADALERLLADPAYGVELGKNGRHKIESRFNLNQNAAQLAALFEEKLR